MLQRDSLSTGLPIENSPPGIQTIPGGALAGAAVVFGIVGSKDKAVTTVGSFDGEADGFIAWTV
jgi:hypothetical protein